MQICSSFVWLVADDWCWFVPTEKYCRLDITICYQKQKKKKVNGRRYSVRDSGEEQKLPPAGSDPAKRYGTIRAGGER
jgi:hypothetical protein